jgi:hypothetical protein
VTSSAQAGEASAVPTGRLWSVRRRSAWDSVWPLGLYAVLSFLLFGLPILDDPTGDIIAADEIDSSVFMWFYGWWPHALLNGLNPFVTGYQFVPEGFNLQWSTSMPLPSLLLSPVTLAFGPSATWNLIQLASPALSGWTAFLLCRHITGRVWPSVAAGYVFGFSPYMLVHLTGGPYLALVPLVPLLALLVLRRIQDSVSPRRFTVAMTAALTAQYLISIEVLATATVFGAVALVTAFLLYREHRAALVATGKQLIVTYAATAVLVTPFLYYFFFGDQYPPGATYFRADLASFVLPPNALAITKSHSPDDVFRGAVFEAYLGLPLIALILVFAWQYRRRRSTWLLLVCLVVPAIAMLGEKLIVRGRLTDIPLPWAVLGDLPVLEHAIPVRFALFVALAAAVIVALWLTAGGVARWALTVLVIASFLPNVGDASWETNINDPAFFEAGQYRDHLQPADHVLTVPVWGPNERWQADTEFAFKLAAGYLSNPFPPSYSRYPIWDAFLTAELPRDYAGELRRFVHDKEVTAVVVDKRHPGPWRKLFGTLGERPLDIGGVLFYRLGPASGR